MFNHDKQLSWLIFIMLGIYLMLEWHFQRPEWRSYLIRLAIVLTGILMEIALSKLSITSFESQVSYIPHWLATLWVCFGLTFAGCYRWTNQYPASFSLALGALFGPMTYWLASRFAPIDFYSPVIFTCFSAIFWGLLFYCVRASRWLNLIVYSDSTQEVIGSKVKQK